ncbi:MAG: hypothetical protein U1E27_04320 [Kiritimatiellia bacterium]|nr:hypothetical protein [Kiritimatiellia bacterium]
MNREERRQMWQAHIEACAESGQGVRSYCAAHQLKEWQYYSWQRRLRSKPEPKGQEAGFIPIQIETQNVLRLRLATGIEIEVAERCSPELLRTALEALRSRVRCSR